MEFFEMISEKRFALSDDKHGTSGHVKKRRYGRFTFIENTTAIHLTSSEPSFWEEIDSFVLSVQRIMSVSKTLFKQLIAFVNFTSDKEDWFC